ncbi:hypothetical protein ACC687_39730, partial [Rhizobium ruizarguesonis]
IPLRRSGRFQRHVSATAGTFGKPKLIMNREPVAGVPLGMAVSLGRCRPWHKAQDPRHSEQQR